MNRPAFPPIIEGMTYGDFVTLLTMIEQSGLADLLFPPETRTANAGSRFAQSIELLRRYPPDTEIRGDVLDAILEQVDMDQPPADGEPT